MSGGHDDTPALAIFQPDNQADILGLPRASSTFTSIFTCRQPLFVQIDCARGLDLVPLCAIEDDQAVQLTPPFGVDRGMCRECFCKI